jgi:hypothetical protein
MKIVFRSEILWSEKRNFFLDSHPGIIEIRLPEVIKRRRYLISRDRNTDNLNPDKTVNSDVNKPIWSRFIEILDLVLLYEFIQQSTDGAIGTFFIGGYADN